MIWCLLAFVAAAVVAFYLHGADLYLRREDVPVRDLPKEAEGFRIAVLSDLHDRRFGKNGKRLSRAVARSGADLILLAGDMHAKNRPAEPFYALLSDLCAIAPVFYSDGNHDVPPREKEAFVEHMRRMRACGVKVLFSRNVPVIRNGKTLFSVYGLSWFAPESAVPYWEPSVPKVLLHHDPMIFDRLPSLPDLTIAGHVHGGMIKLPWLGAVFAPGNGAPLYKRFRRAFFFPKYSEGLYFRGTSVLAVSRGLGFAGLPIRFFRPEIPILTLKSTSKAKNS